MSVKTDENKEMVIGILKFVYPEYGHDFENSNLFFNNLQRFHSIEHKEIGDRLEGVISNRLGNKYDAEDDVEMYIRRLDDPNSKIHKFNVKEVVLKNKTQLTKDFKICCFSLIRFKDLVEVSDGNYKLSQKFINEMSGIIDHRNIYITFDLKSFIDKIVASFSEQGTYFKTAIVKYFENKHPLFYKIENNEKLTPQDFVNAIFYKTDTYSNQKEYRILTHKLEGNKIEVKGMFDDFIQLNSLEQIAVKLY